MSLIPPMLTARPQNNALFASSGSTAGVTQVVAGDASITVSPAGGTGIVTLTVPPPILPPTSFAPGMIIMYSTLAAPPVAPTGWLICDGSGGTPDLRDRFIVGAGLSYAVTQTGGAASTLLTLNMLPDHIHNAGAPGSQGDNPGSASTTYSQGDSPSSGIKGGWVGGTPVPTVPPYYALFYIIKT